MSEAMCFVRVKWILTHQPVLHGITFDAFTLMPSLRKHAVQLTCWMTFMMVAPANHSLAWIRESNQKPVLFSAVASVLIYNGMVMTHGKHRIHS